MSLCSPLPRHPSPTTTNNLALYYYPPAPLPVINFSRPAADPRSKHSRQLPTQERTCTQFLSLERKQPQRRQPHEHESALLQQQATNPRSPLKATADNQAQTPKLSPRAPASAATHSASKLQSPSQSAQCLPAKSLETHRVSGTSSPGAVSTGLQRLMLE